MENAHKSLPADTRRRASSRGLFWWARSTLVVVGCALVACPNGATRNPKTSMTFYKLGHDYFNRALKAPRPPLRDRYLNVALVELRKSLKYDALNHHAHFLVAILYLFKGQKATEEIEVHQCLAGTVAKEYRREQQNLWALALKHFLAAHRLRKGKDSRIALNLSTVYLAKGDYAQAESYGRKALSDIAYATPHLARGNVGRAQFHRKKLIKALKNLKQAVFSQPRFCPGYYWLGRVEFQQNKYESAARRFKKALECCTREKLAPIQEAELFRGLALTRMNKAPEAQLAFKRCTKQAPKSCVAKRCRKNLKAVAGSGP